jgi:hypothetical protein
MSMSEAGDILDEATREVPEEIMDNPKVENAMQYLFDTLSVLTDWIDPDSDAYREELYEMEQQGAFAVAEYYRKALEDALYRQRMFGTQFDLERFLDGLHHVSVQEVLDEAR